ncbi:hypothetical protein [Kaarinaea lacus]|jgi:hypothetical protein
MGYNSLILNEQGGSVLRADSGALISLQSGASLSLAAGAGLDLGVVQIMWAASAAAPSGLPVTASPGAVFFRSDGANSAGYINTSDGTSGSVWTIFSEL